MADTNLKENSNFILKLAALTFIVIVSTFVLWQVLSAKQNEILQLKLLEQVKKYRNSLQFDFNNSLLEMERMANRWEIIDGLQKEHWVDNAENYLIDSPHIQALIRILPDATTSWTVTWEGENKLPDELGKIFSDYFLTMVTSGGLKETTLSPVFDSSWGSIIFALTPLRNDNSFDGHLVEFFNLNEMMEVALRGEKKSNYSYSIYQNKRELLGNYKKPLDAHSPWAAFQTAEVLHLSLKLWLWPTPVFFKEEKSYLPEVVLLSGIVMAALLALALLLERRTRIQAARLKEAQVHLEQKKTENALKESKDRFSKIIKTALDAIIIIDVNGNIITWNQQATNIFGWNEHKVLGQNLADLIIPLRYREAHKNGIQKYLQTGEGPVLNSRIEITSLRNNGEEFPIELSISPIIDGEKITFSGFLRDLTEIKRAEKKLQDATKTAKAANRAKSEFLANTSHEIRTPLNAITGFSKILLKLLNQNKVGKDFEQYLGIIIRSGENLTEVINNVLDLSKIESGKMDILKESFDLKVVIKSLVAIYKHQAMEKGIELEYRFDKELEGLIISDRVKLNQILTNLIGNSLKFTENGYIHINARKQDKNILFSVRDSGIGIPADRIDIIFNAFEQADSSMTRNYGGTGLGLAITKKMSELLGGKIWLESEEGKGSTFYFEIPLEKVEIISSSDQKDSEVLFSHENKILLVDDNEENLLLTKLILEGFGLNPILARNGIEAIKTAIKISPNMILMDLQMPQMDGLEATRQIRDIDEIKNTPIVGLSAHAMKEHEEDALKAGLDDYLTKPLDSNKLEKVCLKFLSLKPKE